MQTLEVLAEVQRRNVKLWPAGDYLEFSPASALTPELVEGLRENKEYILEYLKRREERRRDTTPPVANTGEVLELAREVLPELIQANSPPPPGRDPMVKRNTDKALFFSRDRWREAWPRDFKVYKGGRS